MNWTELLLAQVEPAYQVTEGLVGLVEDDELEWKPATGKNWMNMGQLLRHIAHACGEPSRGFVTGDWGLPEGVKMEDLSPEEMLPPAESMGSVSSVAEVQAMLAEDKQTMLGLISQTGEGRLAAETASAPWDPTEMVLGLRLLQMIQHLALHKAQLFYYLKLQGKLVNTTHLWGGM